MESNSSLREYLYKLLQREPTEQEIEKVLEVQENLNLAVEAVTNSFYQTTYSSESDGVVLYVDHNYDIVKIEIDKMCVLSEKEFIGILPMLSALANKQVTEAFGLTQKAVQAIQDKAVKELVAIMQPAESVPSINIFPTGGGKLN